MVALSGCSKTIPGSVMALARLDVPAVMLYGGLSHPGASKVTTSRSTTDDCVSRAGVGSDQRARLLLARSEHPPGPPPEASVP
jgi:dihydroxy-acid dehydratase